MLLAGEKGPVSHKHRSSFFAALLSVSLAMFPANFAQRSLILISVHAAKTQVSEALPRTSKRVMNVLTGESSSSSTESSVPLSGNDEQELRDAHVEELLRVEALHEVGAHHRA